MDLAKPPLARLVPGHDPAAYEDCDPALLGGSFALAGQRLVVTEEVPAPAVAVFFDAGGVQRLQLGGRLLGDDDPATVGPFRAWAAVHASAFLKALGERYVMHGVWARVTPHQFYDLLPHAFLETDVFDRERGVFLSAQARRAVLFGLPVMPQLVPHDGAVGGLAALARLVRPSLYRSERWRERLAEAVADDAAGLALRQTVDRAEPPALHLRQQGDGIVEARWRYVSRAVAHARRRAAAAVPAPVRIENRLLREVDIMAPTLELPGAYDDLATLA